MAKSKKSTEHRTPLTLEQTIVKLKAEQDHLFFTRYFFKHRQNLKFRVNWHHMQIGDVIEAVIQGTIKNVVINVSPGSSKTEEVVINLIARGLALNPWARFLHLSYSDDLALQNSQSARDLVTSDEYQALWQREIADDSKSKKRWNVMHNGKRAGGVYATSLGGQITGFRAGHMKEGFQGAILIDDPLKPEDSFSETKLKQANRKLLSTVKSRKANPDTPIVVIMQRIAQKDPTDFILTGAMGGEWTHVVIPAIIDDAYVAKLDEKYRKHVDSSERDDKKRFSYWPYKERIEELVKMESGEGMDQDGERLSRHVYAGQYGQNPVAIGGNIIKGIWFKRYTVLPKLKRRKIFVDTAQKTKERNDFSVFEEWGLGEDGNIYLLDLFRKKMEAPELEQKFIEFWNKCRARSTPAYGKVSVDGYSYGQLIEAMVEDKSSGTGLIQKIKLLNQIPIKGIERNIDKLTRVMDVVAYIEMNVQIPADAPFTFDFVAECEAFTADDSHAFDDQVDPMIDAINDMLQAGNKLRTWEKLI